MTEDDIRRLADAMEREGEHDLSPHRVAELLRAVAAGALTLPQMIHEFVPEDHL